MEQRFCRLGQEDGVRIILGKEGMKHKFKNYYKAKEFVDFYNQIHPDYSFEITEHKVN